MGPDIVIKEQNYHPQPKRGSEVGQMHQNMTQNGSKNSQKQPPSPQKKIQHSVPSICVEIPLNTFCDSIQFLDAFYNPKTMPILVFLI
jgi:hypothetical protein